MRVFVLLFTLLLAGSAFAADLPAVRARGELRWGGDLQGGEPYVFEDPEHSGAIVGFEVEIARALAQKLGVREHFVQNDWSNLSSSLERGDFDVILNGLEDTPSRRERFLLSLPYYRYGETLTVRRASPFRSLASLTGKRVGTLNQTVAHDLLLRQGFEVALYEGQQEPYLDLENGRTDAVLLDHVIADRYGCLNPQLVCLPGDVARGSYVIGIAKSDAALKTAIDAALRGLVADGELEHILRTWHLWDLRQTELGASVSADPAKAPEPAEAPRSAASALFSVGQLRLFAVGALMTLAISCSAFALALPLGLLLAALRLYAGRFARLSALIYVELFRGTPALLQLYVLYYGIAGFVRLGPFAAAVLALGLNYAAYEAEVQRGALLAIPRGQTEAASALGLSQGQILRHVLLPQSLRNALPAITNDFVALLKDSSLVSVITVVELTKRMTIASAELRTWLMPGLLCAALYLAMSVPLSRWALRLERRLSAR
ncbi:MAG TPA: ABC transporter permease subunit [Polyangiaceae bacterium]